MDQLILEVVKNVPFTVAVLLIYFLLTKQQLNNARKDSESKDAILGRLISLIDKLSDAIDSLEKTMNSRSEAIQEQSKQIDRNTTILNEVRAEIKELRKLVDPEARLQRTPNSKP